jgi:tetraacyldisaccharide 4'-kinase
MLKSFRYLLFPFSLVYGGAVWLRNVMYNKGMLKSTTFNFPLICVGNLAVGGTGKTPMTEYLIRLLRPGWQVATLSRGYKRKTKGFAIANEATTALEIGDEPMQFHEKFPEITVAVGEERLVAIPQLLHSQPDTGVIILDDAFQHRQVKAGLNILLTEYRNLYTRDLMMPAGDLRDVRSSRSRADIIVVTKCPSGLTGEERNTITQELKPTANQTLYFTEIIYAQPYHLFSHQPMNFGAETEILLICGIANPRPLKDFLAKQVHTYDMLRYADHHIFSIGDLEDIKKQYAAIASPNKMILTTEKDAVRLHKFAEELAALPIGVIPIEHAFLFGQADAFDAQITGFVGRFSQKPQSE